MGKRSLRALAAEHVRALNTLIVGATVEELHDILAALAASQAHAAAQLLECADQRQACSGNPYMTTCEAAALTGYSRSFLYEHGERLGIAVRPDGARGPRFIRERVTRWMETRG